MTSCHEMKLGQVYMCEDCGLELKVIKECQECGTDESECTLDDCAFKCCGQEMKLKAQD
jgi:hypothetical protein